MKVYCAGAAGFICSHVIDQLLLEGNEVFALDNFTSGSWNNIPSRDNLIIMAGDIRDIDLVYRTMDMFKPDVILHAAINPITHPIDVKEDIDVNINGTVNLINAAKKYNVSRVIYLQTALVYGSHFQFDPFPLTQPLNPNSSYAITKAAAESFIRHSGLDYISFRIENHYGPRNLSGAAPVFFKLIKEGKYPKVTQDRRGFVFIKDTVPLIIKACNMIGAAGIYHVSAGRDNSIIEFYEEMCKILNVIPQYTLLDNPPTTLSVDDSKTREVFDWKPTHDLYEGLVQTIAWYEANGVEKTYTHLEKAV